MTDPNTDSDWIMFAIFAAVSIAAFFLHSVACNLHVAAVDRLRAHGGKYAKAYRISYNYCKIVGFPTRKLFGQ